MVIKYSKLQVLRKNSDVHSYNMKNKTIYIESLNFFSNHMEAKLFQNLPKKFKSVPKMFDSKNY